jgi:hypothetical protein
MTRGKPTSTKDLLASERTLLDAIRTSASGRSNFSAFAPANLSSTRGLWLCGHEVRR